MQFSADQYSKVNCIEIKWGAIQYSAAQYVEPDFLKANSFAQTKFFDQKVCRRNVGEQLHKGM